jgi:hypothetical protein
MNNLYAFPRTFAAIDALFFIHIPKTAGTSMRAILDMHFDATTICPINQWADFAYFAPERVKDYRLLRGHFPYSVSQYFDRPPVMMTMLRHPVELIISYYRFIQRMPEHPLRANALQLPLVDFVAKNRYEVIEQTRYLSAGFDMAWQPAVNEREALALAKERLNTLPFVGIMEEFNRSLQVLFHLFAWRPLQIIPALNRAPTPTSRHEFAPTEISAIEELAAVDIELYEYGRLLFELNYQRMMQVLLDYHYEGQNPAWNNPQSIINLSMEQAFEGENWHDREYLHEKWVYRWSGPTTVSSADIGLVPNQSYHIDIHVLFAISDYILNTWHLRVNGLMIPLQRSSHPETGDVFRGIIPLEALKQGQRFTRLEIIVVETLRPSNIPPGSADERDLGIAVSSFRLYPILA